MSGCRGGTLGAPIGGRMDRPFITGPCPYWSDEGRSGGREVRGGRVAGGWDPLVSTTSQLTYIGAASAIVSVATDSEMEGRGSVEGPGNPKDGVASIRGVVGSSPVGLPPLIEGSARLSPALILDWSRLKRFSARRHLKA